MSSIGPMVGLSGGAHFFFTPAVSLDISALLDARWLFSRSRTFGDNAPDPDEWAATRLLNFGFGLGLSAWF